MSYNLPDGCTLDDIDGPIADIGFDESQPEEHIEPKGWCCYCWTAPCDCEKGECYE